ncbi:type VI secretion system baseplate subunit TssF [Acinetobacter baumannii]
MTRIWSTISEFAQKYPKIAQRLSLNQEQIDDPHIERLIQAFR